jgi:TonB family protein
MKQITLAVSVLLFSLAASAQQPAGTSSPGDGNSQPVVYTYALELDSNGGITALAPKEAMPAQVDAELERLVRGWVFVPAEVDNERVATRTFLRIAVQPSRDAAQPLKLLSVTTGPAPDSLRSPEYPVSAKRRGEEGVVVLKLEVGADGRVQDVEFYGEKQRATRTLANAARAAAREWRFIPEQADGVPVSSTVVMPVCFMATDPTPATCTWEGPDARRFSRMTVLTLDPAARVVTDIAYNGAR